MRSIPVKNMDEFTVEGEIVDVKVNVEHFISERVINLRLKYDFNPYNYASF
jgi:hypothetical protein